MIFITGPMFSGKRTAAMKLLHCSREELAEHAVWEAEKLACDCGDLEKLADELAANEVVIASEVGAGIVPADAEERRNREAAGRLAILLAQRADTVLRVFCGIPTVLKGTLS